jgi:hypothetical protein
MSERRSEMGQNPRSRDRRAYERFKLEVSGGSLNYKGIRNTCEIVDISLSGCCIRTQSKFLAGNLAHVEVELPIHGMLLRMVGIIQWVGDGNLLGIKFFHASARSKNQLAGLLTCLVDDSASEVIKAAVAVEASTGSLGSLLALELPTFESDDHITARTPQEKDEGPELEPHDTPGGPQHRSANNASPTQKVEQEEWPATLRFLKDSSKVAGAITGLSLEKCSVRTAEDFHMGIQIRVEVEFQMRGLPFRLGGVIEDVKEMQFVEIRFLGVSQRKREELSELLDELREQAKSQLPTS